MDRFTDAQVFERLQELCRSAMKSPFYAGLIKKVPETTSDFEQIPFLTRQDVYDNSYPKSSDLLTIPAEGLMLSSTGGSSGVARYTVLSHSEWDVLCGLQADALIRAGISEKDIIANLMVAGSMWPSFLAIHEIIKTIGATHLPISANIDMKKIVDYLIQFKPTVVISLPTFFVFLSDIANREKIDFSHIKTIGYAGEHMSKEVRKYVSESLGVDNIKALAYTSADVGLMGYQCDRCAPNEYHLPKGYQYIEIYDFENNRLCENGEKGEVVVTCLVKHAMPIIRYRLGDVATIKKTKCACGDENPVFELAGRAGEDFKLGGAYISMNVFEETVGEFAGKEGISMNHTLTLEDVQNKMNIILHVESADPAASAVLTESIKESLKAKVPEIKTGLQMGFFNSFDVVFIPSGQLERSPITGKVKRLNDKRVVE